MTQWVKLSLATKASHIASFSPAYYASDLGKAEDGPGATQVVNPEEVLDSCAYPVCSRHLEGESEENEDLSLLSFPLCCSSFQTVWPFYYYYYYFWKESTV